MLPSATSLVKANAAAVGSLIIPLQSRPAILAAFFVDYFWLSVKYAGTVMTHFVTGALAFISALVLILSSTLAYTYSGYNFVSTPLILPREIIGLECWSGTTSNGHRSSSFVINESLNLSPIILLASKIVICDFRLLALTAPLPIKTSPLVE